MSTVPLSPPQSVLIAGSSAAAVGTLAALLRDQTGWRATTLVTMPSATLAEALKTASAAGTAPRVLIVACSDDDLGDLEALAKIDATLRPPLIVCGTLRGAESNRAALRAGAIDLDARELEPTANCMVVLLTYWLSFEYVRDPRHALEPDNAQAALLRGAQHVLNVLAPYLEAGQRQHLLQLTGAYRTAP